jgi:hypothetical protein
MKAQIERPTEERLRVLTHDELTERIRSVELLDDWDGHAEEPRWIEAAELIRRVAPWLSNN